MATLKQQKPVRSDSHIVNIRSAWCWQFIVVLAIAIAVRLYQLGTESLWVDEGYSLKDATYGAGIARASKPLYYWLLSLWIPLGQSDSFLRFPSVLFGILSVALTFIIGQMIWDRRTGSIAAVLAALSPLQVNHSQEIRMYTLLTLMSLCSVYYFLLGTRTWQFKYMLLTGIFNWLAIITHPLASLMLFPQSIAIVDAYLRNRRPLIPWVCVQAAVLLAWLPWLQHVLGYGESVPDLWIAVVEKSSFGQIPYLWSVFGLGEWDAEAAGSLLHPMLFVYIYLAVSVIAWVTVTERRKPEVRFVSAWLIIPAVILVLLSMVKTNAWIPRYLIFTSPAFFLLLGAMLAKARNRLCLAVLALVLLFLPAGKLVRYYQKNTRPEWRQAIKFVTEHQNPDDFIAVYRHGNKDVFKHYYKGRAEWQPIGPELLWKQDIVNWNKEKAANLVASIPGAPRKWLIVSMVTLGAEEAIDSVIRTRYDLITYRKYNGIRVYLFRSDRVKEYRLEH